MNALDVVADNGADVTITANGTTTVCDDVNVVVSDYAIDVYLASNSLHDVAYLVAIATIASAACIDAH